MEYTLKLNTYSQLNLRIWMSRRLLLVRPVDVSPLSSRSELDLIWTWAQATSLQIIISYLMCFCNKTKDSMDAEYLPVFSFTFHWMLGNGYINWRFKIQVLFCLKKLLHNKGKWNITICSLVWQEYVFLSQLNSRFIHFWKPYESLF